MSFPEKVENLLQTIYGEDFSPHYKSEIVKLAESWKEKKWSKTAPLSEKTSILLRMATLLKKRESQR